MSSKKFFSVIVGGRNHKPAKVQVGFLDESGKPKDESITAYIEKAGTAVPNYSRIWGKRGEIKEKGKETVSDGTITPLKWGDPDGYVIEIRYLKSSTSLDKEFQERKKLRVTDRDAEIDLSVGVNNFDPVREKMLCLMLSLHYQNAANESREPGIPVAFETYDPNKITMRKTTDVQARQEVELIVINANEEGEGSLEILASLFTGMDPRQQTDILFNELMEMTQTFGFFQTVLDHHRDEYRQLIENAKELALIDVSPADAIHLTVEGKRDILIGNIDSGKLTNVAYVMKYFYKPEYFNKLQSLKALYEKYKVLVLE